MTNRASWPTARTKLKHARKHWKQSMHVLIVGKHAKAAKDDQQIHRSLRPARRPRMKNSRTHTPSPDARASHEANMKETEHGNHKKPLKRPSCGNCNTVKATNKPPKCETKATHRRTALRKCQTQCRPSKSNKSCKTRAANQSSE